MRLRTPLYLLLLSLAPAFSFAQCDLSFTANILNDTLFFEATNLMPGENAYWEITSIPSYLSYTPINQNSGSLASAAPNEDFEVFLEVYSGSCFDDTVFVIENCPADFTYRFDGDTLVLTPKTSLAGTNILNWYVDDTLVGDPTQTYLINHADADSVSLEVIRSGPLGCTNEASAWVIDCDATFSADPVITGSQHNTVSHSPFYLYNISGGFDYNYSCCVGCGLNLPDVAGFDYCAYNGPSGAFSGPGTYDITLYVSDFDTICYDSAKQTVTYDPSRCDTNINFITNGLTATVELKGQNLTNSYTRAHWGDGSYFGFDDQSFSNSSASRTFSAPGFYTVDVQVSSIEGACQSSVTREFSLNAPNLPSCGASQVPFARNGKYMHYTLDSPVQLADNQVTWDIWQQSSSSVIYSTNGFVLDRHNNVTGTHVVRTVVSTPSCFDILTDTIELKEPFSASTCDAQLNFALSTNGTSALFLDASHDSNLTQNFQSTLTFGDGSSQILAGQLASHTYSTPGQYEACLTISDTLGCQDTECVSLNIVPQTPPTPWSVSGGVSHRNSTTSFTFKEPDHAVVYLISVDAAAGNLLTAVDSVVLTPADSGDFNFSGLTDGSYYIKAALLPNDPFYNQVLPTYFGKSSQFSGGVSQWVNATPFVPTSNSQFNFLTLETGNNPGGPGFVGGSLSSGANKVTDLDVDLSERAVMLFNVSNNSLVDFDLSDQSDAFAIDSVPYGTYRLHGEVLGLQTFDHIITLDTNQPSINDLEVRVNTATTNSRTDAATYRSMLLYPNPAQDLATLQIALQQSAQVQLQAYDIKGHLVLVQSGDYASGEAIIGLNTAELADGLYTLQVQIGAEVEHFKLVVQR